MKGVDTNVLLRLLLKDDAAQVVRAEQCISEATKDGPVLVNPIVLSELTWTLSRRIRLPRMEVADIVAELLLASDLAFMFKVPAQRALDAFRQGKADYADYLIAEINAEGGCATTFTFDREAQKHPSFTPIP